MIESPDLAFGNGFLATSEHLDGGDGWERASIGPLNLLLHPTLNRDVRVGSSGNGVALLGDPVDVDRYGTRRVRITKAILSELDRRGLGAAIRYIAYLGGRFVCIIHRPHEPLVIVPDCHASLPVYWQNIGRQVVLSSHSHLLAEATDTNVDEQALGLMRRCKEMGTGGTHYLPGIRTPFDGVRPLLPNHMLSIDGASGDVEHVRFYPGLVQAPSYDDNPQERLEELFSRHARYLCDYGQIATSLTAGVDSRASLMAALPHLKAGSFTWTWAGFSQPNADVIEDMLVANALAFDLELRHRVIELRRPEADDPFGVPYRRSFGRFPQHPAAAHAMHTQLPHGPNHLMSMLAETGTGFYKKRTRDAFDSRRLSYLYSRFEFGQLQEVIELHEEFIEYASFTADNVGELDYHDLFYWEARAGRWAASRIQEADLSHRVILPFNQRGIIEALLAIPFQQRSEKQPLLRMIDRLGRR